MSNHAYVVGVDEVGRGPIAGPVTVGAVLVATCDQYHERWNRMLDSKKLPPSVRDEWFERVLAWQETGLLRKATASCTAHQIESRGISWCLRQAVARVLRHVGADPESCQILLDGRLYAPTSYNNQQTMVHGDQREPVIGLASIVAKVTRDRHMVRMAKKYSGYGFAEHKGYGTEAHYAAIRRQGLCPIHRSSWVKMAR